MKQAEFKEPLNKKILEPTKILDFTNYEVQDLIRRRGWRQLEENEKVKSIYDFVRNELKFGYNVSDDLPASIILKDGYGQCNTKANVFMALLRGVGIPNRIHGFTIHKALQKGAVTGLWYKLSPKNILHSWVEVYVQGAWLNLEGLILDEVYLSALQQKFSDCTTTFCGYGAYTDTFQNPQVEWSGTHTYIQEKGINQDLGLFDSPDDFYQKHQQNLSPIKKWMFRNYVRHLMNRKVDRIRNGG